MTASGSCCALRLAGRRNTRTSAAEESCGKTQIELYPTDSHSTARRVTQSEGATEANESLFKWFVWEDAGL